MQPTEAYQNLRQELTHLYEPREASTIADMVIESITGLSKSERLIQVQQILNEDQISRFEEMKEELKHGRPIQYVIGYTWFCDLKFDVDERVLIPRPETEELVHHAIEIIEKESKNNKPPYRVLDIGTGSGCIAVSIKKKIAAVEVVAMDISKDALNLAEQNAIQNQVKIEFIQKNILEHIEVDGLPCFDFIISNPPYIPPSDKNSMEKHVLNFEPHAALFTSEQNPLEFYQAIVKFSEFHLTRGGHLAFETHVAYAEEIAEWIKQFEYEEVEIKKDLHGNNRMVFARKSGSSL